jgi:hypothetical protein
MNFKKSLPYVAVIIVLMVYLHGLFNVLVSDANRSQKVGNFVLRTVCALIVSLQVTKAPDQDDQ